MSDYAGAYNEDFNDDYYADDPYDDEDGNCTMCGGEGESECNDWLQCMARHTGPKNGPFYCACAGCGGSGEAKDQRIW